MKFKQLLREKDITGAQLARRINVSVYTVWKWTNGKGEPVAARMIKIADALGVSVEEIVRCFAEKDDDKKIV